MELFDLDDSALVSEVKRKIPDVAIDIDQAEVESGSTWIDFRLGEDVVAVEANPKIGFRLYEQRAEGLGDGASAIVTNPKIAAYWIVYQLSSHESSHISSLLSLARSSQGITQADLAARLGNNQAAVSKMEKRGEQKIGSVIAVIEALGGTLEVKGHLPGCELSIYPERTQHG